MRLTLRTLLAHLDHTLDPDDDAAIAAKLRESDFASKLADHVRACLQSDALEAPSPLATGTADDPNRIGEYLDSVLSSEQVAEVERICLESDAHLAEVASCHQILTLVLAHPAEIPASLRNKLYALRQDSQAEQSSNNGSFAEPVAPLVAENASSETVISPAGMSSKPTRVAAPPISPVGPDDSGVSDAPTRLKEEAALASGSRQGTAESAMAGSKKLSASDLSDFSGRPSRVMPWLVSLALVAAFLFVASKAFAPLLQRRGADQEERLLTLGDPDPRPDVEQQSSPADSPAAADPPADAEATPSPESPSTETPGAETPGAEQPRSAPPDVEQPGLAPPLVEPLPPGVADASPAPAPVPTTRQPPPAPAPPSGADDETPPAVVEVPVPETASATDPSEPTEDSQEMAPRSVASGEDSPPDLPAVSEVPDIGDAVAGEEPIMITSENTLLLVRDPESDVWVVGDHDDVVQPGSELICPPLYRNRLSIHEEVELTMVGPARVTLQQAPNVTAELVLDYGRFLLMGVGEQQRQVSVRFQDTDSVLTLPSAESVAAIEVLAVRPPGMDPENASATQHFVRVLAAQGVPQWRSGNRPEVTLETGQLLTLARGNQISLSDASSIPSWLDEPAEAVASIESSARDGLLALVQGDEAIELSLREAMDFRRAEVGALAAQTLLLLARHDVYFGAEGVFSQPRQRTNWPDHFNAMLDVINRGPETAAAVRGSIEQMDAAQADEIYRLLWLFSNNQLAAGADEKLVEALDSSNMTIRVLAAENLRHITGNTLLYKPEVETPSRRASDIKKWETRLRRGEIRWSPPSEPEEAAGEQVRN